jgi:hypothetical protein
MKGIFKGIITIVIGGTIFTISQADLVKNFSKETGLSQKEAQEYVENVTEDDLVSYDEVGKEFISDGQEMLSSTRDIDCVNYSYEWETSTLSCDKGKSQLNMIANDEIALGQAYTVLASESASREDIAKVIRLIDSLNTDFKFEIVSYILKPRDLDEIRKTNAFNKAMLQSALESEK